MNGEWLGYGFILCIAGYQCKRNNDIFLSIALKGNIIFLDEFGNSALACNLQSIYTFSKHFFHSVSFFCAKDFEKNSISLLLTLVNAL